MVEAAVTDDVPQAADRTRLLIKRAEDDPSHPGLNRRASLAKLALFQGDLPVTVQQAPGHIDESPQPSLNSDFNPDGQNHANASP